MRRLFLTLATCFFTATSDSPVTRIVDGDTLIISDTTRVRLYGIDCPEKNQPYGQEATTLVARIALGERVRIKTQKSDRYGRLVGIVFMQNGETLQEILLEHGMAWVDPRYCRWSICDEWQKMETAARQSHTGLWQDRPVPPWEWRKGRRK